MSASLSQVYEYRRLLARCRSGSGLELAEIEELAGLEAQFAGALRPVELGGLVKTTKAEDRVQIVGLGLAGARVASSPYLEIGDKLELRVDADELSYRFKAVVATLDDDGELYRADLELVGAPLLVRRGPRKAAPLARAA